LTKGGFVAAATGFDGGFVEVFGPEEEDAPPFLAFYSQS